MSGRFLIDATDPRFFTPENADVIAFIRVTNPFAHSDVGDLVFAAADKIPGAHAYCPSVASCAYVVLYTPTDRIVAIAYGQKGIAVRLGGTARHEAIAAGNQPAADIGGEWVKVEPWPKRGAPPHPSTFDWMARAYAEAVDALREHGKS